MAAILLAIIHDHSDCTNYYLFVVSEWLVRCQTAYRKASAETPDIIVELKWRLYAAHDAADGSSASDGIAWALVFGGRTDGIEHSLPVPVDFHARLISNADNVVRHVLQLDRAAGDAVLRAALSDELARDGLANGRDGDGPDQLGRRLVAAFQVLMFLVHAAPAPLSQSSVCVSLCSVWSRLRAVDPAWLRRDMARAPFFVSICVATSVDQTQLRAMSEAGLVELLAVELVAPSLLVHRQCGALPGWYTR